jgi:hypothetical protein
MNKKRVAGARLFQPMPPNARSKPFNFRALTVRPFVAAR